nr:hypothetical protein [uncultured Marvinbryantia sp.]
MTLKRKQIAVILGLALAVSGVSAFAEEDTEAVTEAVIMLEEDQEQEESDIIIGEVKEVGDDSITLAVGDLPEDGEENGASEEAGAEALEDASEEVTDADTSADGESTSAEKPELMLTGEEKTVTVAEDATILLVDWETAKESLKALEDTQEGQTEDNTEAAADGEAAEATEGAAAEDGTEAETAENAETADEADAGTEALTDAEELALTDITEGDILAIQLDEDGNAVQIMVVQQS